MLPTVYIKDDVEMVQISLTLINLLHDVVQVGKHAFIGCLKLYTDYQEIQNLKIHKLVVEESKDTLPCNPPSAKFVCPPAEVSTHRKLI